VDLTIKKKEEKSKAYNFSKMLRFSNITLTVVCQPFRWKYLQFRFLFLSWWKIR